MAGSVLQPGQVMFDRSFAVAVHKFVTNPHSSPVVALKMIADFIPFLDADEFAYANSTEELSGLDALLKCWGGLLDCTKLADGSVDTTFRETVMAAIVRIVSRKEFLLFRLTDDDIWIAFCDMLSRTLRIAEGSIQAGDRAAESFASQVTAVAFCHMPAVVESVVACLQRALRTLPNDELLHEQIGLLSNMAMVLQHAEHAQSRQLPLQRTSVIYYRLEMFDEFFYNFVNQLCMYLHANSGLPAVTINGASDVMLTFLYAIRAEQPAMWTNAVHGAVSAAATMHPLMLDLVLKISLQKTSLYDVPAVDAALCNIERWFDFFTSGAPHLVAENYPLNHPLNSNVFDYEFLVRALDILFQDEHFVVLMRVVRFVFFFISSFPSVPRWHVMIDLVLHRYFFKFFLHWSAGIRQAFHRLVLCKVARNVQGLTLYMRTLLSPPEHAGDVVVRLSPVFAANTANRRDLVAVQSLAALVHYVRNSQRAMRSKSAPPPYPFASTAAQSEPVSDDYESSVQTGIPPRLLIYTTVALSEFDALVVQLHDVKLEQIDLPFGLGMTVGA
eukprot:TRINITY_DN7595_c0_g1_i1.p1 TRINITY_DN7595_c0_g1~~TRINITY_DN7595_c0_g1_i1.p1  ORF type:complete len:582 (+),score=102.29 TRINITY_DN7595_c0_g1_i1:76-1746(+)